MSAGQHSHRALPGCVPSITVESDVGHCHDDTGSSPNRRTYSQTIGMSTAITHAQEKILRVRPQNKPTTHPCIKSDFPSDGICLERANVKSLLNLREPKNFGFAAADPRKPASHPPWERRPVAYSAASTPGASASYSTAPAAARRSRCPRPAAPAPPPALRQPIARSRLSRRAWLRARAPRRRPAPRPPRPARRMVRAPSAPRPRATPPAHRARSPSAASVGSLAPALSAGHNERPRPRFACHSP
ncbi:translation initiation factor IF-2-like [Pteronotus mesoamericanus]|uniref:translation initiation factor IF-2-like n=1 Tax=Pteronotus mesoamericanus TaxID=1884717 RepID=UPI0023EAA421|nr:translation initiation factor IF-2-like [Pteronotus parnellii mesoamericanus]